MTTYICTLGSSIANQLKDNPPQPDKRDTPLNRIQKANAKWDANDESSAAFAKCLAKWIDDLLRKNETAAIDKSSAEITILSKIGVTKDDRIVLLATDTFLGNVCAQQLKRVLRHRFGLDNGQIISDRIVDLQVGDAKRAEKYGYGNFIECARRRLDEATTNGYEVCICPNGGFKGVVPFLTLLGMLYHARTVYMFEHANSVIQIPPLPFSLDGEYFSRAEHALKVLTERIEMPENEYLSLVEDYDPSERDLFLGFVQSCSNGMVTPLSLLEHFISAAAQPFAMLSQQAIHDMQAMEGTERYGVFAKLIMDAQNPAWRDDHRDTYERSDLTGMKRGRTAERLLGYAVGDLFYVARAIEHVEYDRLLKDGTAPQCADFPRSVFRKWQPVGLTRKAAWSAFKALSEHCSKIEDQNKKIRGELDDMENIAKEAEAKLNADVKRLTTELAQAKSRMTALENESRTLLGAIRLWLKKGKS